MGNPNPKQEYAIRAKQAEPRVPCKIKGCNSLASAKTQLCGEHWRNRKKLKTSGYYDDK